MEVHLWGGQGAGGGYGGSCCGGTGAYVYGVLPKSALGSALRIVVGYATAADAGEDEGEGARTGERAGDGAGDGATTTVG